MFFKSGKYNPDLQAVLDNAPHTVGTVTALTDKTLNPSVLLPKKHTEFFTYADSLASQWPSGDSPLTYTTHNQVFGLG